MQRQVGKAGVRGFYIIMRAGLKGLTFKSYVVRRETNKVQGQKDSDSDTLLFTKRAPAMKHPYQIWSL